MNTHHPKTLLAVALFVALVSRTSRGANYESPKGFHLQYPDQWRLATKADREAVGEAARQLVGNIDFDRVDVMIYNPQSDPTQNINVVVTPAAIPIGPGAVSEVEAALRQQLTSAGMSPTMIDCKFTRLGGNDAICSNWVTHIGSQAMRQRQVIVSGKVRSFIITCSAGDSSFADAEPAFTQMLNSFHVGAEPGADPGEWWSRQSPVLRNAIIGAGIGLAIGVVSSLGKLGKQGVQ